MTQIINSCNCNKIKHLLDKNKVKNILNLGDGKSYYTTMTYKLEYYIKKMNKEKGNLDYQHMSTKITVL